MDRRAVTLVAMRFFDRRPLGWLLLGIFAALYSCRSLAAGIEALVDRDAVILFWRVVELAFFSWLTFVSIGRTAVPAPG